MQRITVKKINQNVMRIVEVIEYSELYTGLAGYLLSISIV
jgi:hypothetical protein